MHEKLRAFKEVVIEVRILAFSNKPCATSWPYVNLR